MKPDPNMKGAVFISKNLYTNRKQFAYSAHGDDASVCVSQHLPGDELTSSMGLTSAFYT